MLHLILVPTRVKQWHIACQFLESNVLYRNTLQYTALHNSIKDSMAFKYILRFSAVQFVDWSWQGVAATLCNITLALLANVLRHIAHMRKIFSTGTTL